MALSYINVYLGTDEEGTELKAQIKKAADARGFHSASEFCRFAISEQLAINVKQGGPHGQTEPVES